MRRINAKLPLRRVKTYILTVQERNFMKLNGSEIIMECLLEQGIDTVFGYPGGAVLNIYDALYKYSDKIRHILTAHEQGAATAADGYARATGRPSVVIATSGRGLLILSPDWLLRTWIQCRLSPLPET